MFFTLERVSHTDVCREVPRATAEFEVRSSEGGEAFIERDGDSGSDQGSDAVVGRGVHGEVPAGGSHEGRGERGSLVADVEGHEGHGFEAGRGGAAYHAEVAGVAAAETEDGGPGVLAVEVKPGVTDITLFRVASDPAQAALDGEERGDGGLGVQLVQTG